MTPLQIKPGNAAEESHNKQHIFDKFKRYCDNADTLRGGAVTQPGATTAVQKSAVTEDAGLKIQLGGDVNNNRATAQQPTMRPP